jgi:hypothetical protein
MLKCNKPVEVFNLDEILPSYGENRIEICYKNNDLILSVFFDGEEDESVLIINFQTVVFHKVENIPSAGTYGIIYEKNPFISSVVEYQKSELNEKWKQINNHLFDFHHYKLFLSQENVSIEVICEKFSF